MIKRRRIFQKLAVLCALALVGTGVAAQAEEGTAKAKKGIEPQAEKMLRQMTEYLASLKSFKVQNAAVDEMVTTAGQKIQVASESQV